MPQLGDYRERINYSGYAPSDEPYMVGGQPWAMPGVQPPGQQGPYQGLGDWGSDPFGYSGGSMLTPWTQPLPGWSAAPGVAPNLTAFNYADFGYNYRDPGGFNSRAIDTPERFSYMNFEAPQPFKAPSEAEMMADPAYQARMKSGTNAIERSAAANGSLRGGGTLRGLMEYGQRTGTEAYDNIYGKRASEYDRAYGMAKDTYGMNRANTAENYDRNITNRLRVAEGNEDRRLAGYSADAASAANMGRLGYDVATGTYDRNQALARDRWQTEMDAERARAAAINGANSENYARQMQQYGMAYDIFNNNQDRQWDRLTQMTGMGMAGAGAQAGYAGMYGGQLGDLYTGAANARAAGTVAGGNAWNQALSGIGNSAMELGLMYGGGGGGGYYGGLPGARYTPQIPRY
jgi:hypothetical protein